MPTNADAIEAVRRIDASAREASRQLKLSLAICTAIGALLWLLEPWLIVASIIAFLIAVGFITNADSKRRGLSSPTLERFAEDLNWYRSVKTELRHVEGYQRRRRFYADPVLIPIEMIIRQIREGIINRWPEPPFGEVPRMQPGPTAAERIEDERIPAEIKRAKEKRIEGGRIAAKIKLAEEKRIEEERIAAEIKLAEEKRFEEERIAAEIKLADEKRLAAERKRKEERRRYLEAPRIHVQLKERWSDALSIKDLWHLISEGEISLESLGYEFGIQDAKRLDEFPELASLFVGMEIENKRDLREQSRRDRRERDECIDFHGTVCAICSFSFETQFGEIGEGYIEAHHLNPVANDANLIVRIVNPVTDLRPVCANCHRMLHRRNPPYSILEIIEIRKSGDEDG